jgi:hypothetical protein
MKIQASDGRVIIDASDVLIIGFHEQNATLEINGHASVTSRMGYVAHSHTFGKGWMGRVLMALWVYRTAGTMRKQIREEAEARARGVRERS